jgi:hypothetical protein
MQTTLFKFNKTYFALAVVIFIIEVLIALYVHDTVVRPYIGDLLVVILIYCFIKAFLKVRIVPTSIFVLLFSFFVETMQYLNIVTKLGLEDSKIARTVIGTSFEWIDLIAYTSGIIIVLLIEKLRLEKQ